MSRGTNGAGFGDFEERSGEYLEDGILGSPYMGIVSEYIKGLENSRREVLGKNRELIGAYVEVIRENCESYGIGDRVPKNIPEDIHDIQQWVSLTGYLTDQIYSKGISPKQNELEELTDSMGELWKSLEDNRLKEHIGSLKYILKERKGQSI
ncbi:MAG: hypothetical protein WDZ69_00090 [Candidatus Pacearchaeota archaeon]